MNDKQPCKDIPADRSSYEQFPSLTAILTQLQSLQFNDKSADLIFAKLAGVAEVEKQTGQIPKDSPLNEIVQEIEARHLEDLGHSVECNVAFKSLKYIAEQMKK
jgi:hypothetical protein